MTLRDPLFPYSAARMPEPRDDRALDIDDTAAADAARASGGGYENAPCTKLLATHCCMCGKPLRDADSVTAGIGPDCRKKYGSAEIGPEAPARSDVWIRVNDAARRAGIAEWPEGMDHDQPRDAANKLIHRVGRDPQGAITGFAVVALWALGYHKVAAKLAAVTGVVVEETETDFVVRTPYDARFGSTLRRHNAWAKFHSTDKTWRVGKAKRAQLWAALIDVYEGKPILGPAGMSIVARPQRATAAE